MARGEAPGLESFDPGQGPAPAPVPGDGDCPAVSGDPDLGMVLYCTRDAGHPGPFHEAEGTAGQLVGRWPV